MPVDEGLQLVRGLVVAGHLVVDDFGPVDLLAADEQDEGGRGGAQGGEVHHHPTGGKPDRYLADGLVLVVVDGGVFAVFGGDQGDARAADAEREDGITGE